MNVTLDRFKADQRPEAAALAAGNRHGVEMVVLETCRRDSAGCSNALIDTAPWRAALEDWLSRDQVSERLRRRIVDDRMPYHHKLRLVVAGCPNGCSRPQIADLALTGFVRPSFNLDACSACKTCAEACPDQAIVVEDELKWNTNLCQGCLACGRVCPDGAVSLTRPGARILMGGKLGRHPRLALIIGEVHEPTEAVRYFAEAVDEYIDNAAPGERFAAWRSRVEKGTS
ncbi:MAG: 4Fe-4S binding protein [Thermodesulfobacteriota bacterium]|nr:4Fe-4S binding protein [Thermodesulfobacteriota bacterium]